MILKLVAFVFMSVGALIVLGIISGWSPSLHHTAVVLGTYAISWFQLIAVGVFGMVCYLLMKIR